MFKLTLVTPEKKIETDLEVDEIVVPGFRGQLDILPGHAPLVTTLSSGLVRYKPKGSSEFQAAVTSWGYCEVFPNGVYILAETAETKEEVDRERAEESLKKSLQLLESKDLPVDEVEKYQRKIKRARARLELVD